MAILMVTYVGNAISRFDRGYYDNHHIPLAQQAWAPFGLDRVEVFYPVKVADASDIVAMSLCYFADRDGLDRALAAGESEAVAADIASFTDIEPIRTIVTATGRAD